MLLTGVGLQNKVKQEDIEFKIQNNTVKKTEDLMPEHFVFLSKSLFGKVCSSECSKL